MPAPFRLQKSFRAPPLVSGGQSTNLALSGSNQQHTELTREWRLLAVDHQGKSMQRVESLAERSLGAVIAAIASDSVVPGAGSAAAVGLALAAACAGKAIAVTLKHHPGDAQLIEARDVIALIAQHALHGADEDAAQFREFMHEKDAASAQSLVDIGKRMQQIGAALLDVIARIDTRIDPSVRGDITAARALCNAFSEIQTENLAENRDALKQIDTD